MKCIVSVLLVLALASLGQDIPKCTKSENTMIYIRPARDRSYVKDNVNPVPGAAPFKSVEFDALLKQSVLERVHNVTFLTQQPFNPGYVELNEAQQLALNSIEQLLQYSGQSGGREGPPVRGVMFVSEYNCAANAGAPLQNLARTPGSYCNFKLNLQLGGFPAYWNFPKDGGTIAMVNLAKTTPGFLKQAADNLADQLEQYRLKAEKICLDRNIRALHGEQEKANRASQALAYRKWDNEEKTRVAQLPSLQAGPACPTGTHHPDPEVVNEEHKLKYLPVCAEKFPTEGGQLTVLSTCEQGWNLEYEDALRFNVCSKAIPKNLNAVPARIQPSPVPTAPVAAGAACPAGTHHPAPEINAEHRLEYLLVCAKQFPIQGDATEPSECEKGWELEEHHGGFDTCSKPLPTNPK
jgi:hypothetical protein